MKEWIRRKCGGAAAFLAICGLVAGGLGWATAAAMRLEDEQLAEHARTAREEQIRLALWRLDSYVAPLLAVEDGRPFNHYSAVFAAPLAFDNRGVARPPGAVVEPSPLLNADLPDWMLLHFQLDASTGWESPQAPSINISHVLQNPPIKTTLANATPERTALLEELKNCLRPAELIAAVRERVSPTTRNDTIVMPAARTDFVNNRNNDGQNNSTTNPSDYDLRQQTTQFNPNQAPQRFDRSVAMNSIVKNGENWLTFPGPQGPPGAEVLVHLTSMTALWTPTKEGRERLLLVRLVRIEEKEVCQGIVLDDDALRRLLADKIADLFPQARLLPVHEPTPLQPERTMTALPFQLDPGPAEKNPGPGWTPLRVGLALAWAAALVALAAVGLGGLSLLNLSERRIRFVSAVTHELRTPLTTLRLYLDMLMNGLVRDEKQREEYIQTLNAEANRLSRLVGNVLDYSRLERQRPRLNRSRISATDLLAQVGAVWQGRCRDADKELVIEEAAPAALCTDGELVQQILGNLLDNACKYSRGASDRRVWLRVRRQGRRLVFEVEDGGPGVPKGERGMIFRAFRRGQGAEAAVTGGVGLGLALARSWARLLGGDLTLRPTGGGACFRLMLPADGG